MPHNKIDANVRCPSCNGPLYPRVLVCDACGLKIEGDFVLNEFGTLTPDELHFLRVFIYCEGRIRDMEAALGVSYPTVKGHLAAIKARLNLAAAPGALEKKAGEGDAGTAARAGREPAGLGPGGETGSNAPDAGLTQEEILDRLETGGLSYKEAVKLLRAQKKGTGDEQIGG
ncbi:MAG TPA: DUF2089 family protein [Spirochaetia bacterium]